MSGLSARAWRALAFVGLAAVAVVALGVSRLGGWPAGPAAAPGPTSTPRATSRLDLASFGDATHGAVVMDSGAGTAPDTYLTADGGRTWTPRHVGISVTTFLDRDHAIEVLPGPNPGLESSADGGRTWVRLTAPVRAAPLGLLLNRSAGGPVFLDPRNGWWLDAPPLAQPGTVALWHTADGGRSWRALAAAGLPKGWLLGSPAFIAPNAGALVAVPAHGPQPLVLTTRDGGDTWTPAPLPDAPIGGAAVALATSDAAQLIVEHGRLVLSIDLTAPGGGEFSHWTSISEDGGQTWAPWVKEPAATSFVSAAPFIGGAGQLLVTDDQTLWSSADAGRTWQPRPLGLPSGDHALAVVFDSGSVLVVVAAGPPPAGFDDLRLLRSDDAGGRWTQLRLPPASVS